MPEKPTKERISPQKQRRAGDKLDERIQQIDPAGRHRQDQNENAKGGWSAKKPGEIKPSDKRRK